METPDTFLDHFYIEQAGIVIVWSFLPMLFERCGYLDNGVFIDKNAQHRAYQLLYLITTGEALNTEFEYPLFKILCGMKVTASVFINGDVTDTEKEFAKGMLNAVIDSWRVLGDTTIDGLRETFLQRTGKLELEENGTSLKVEEKTYDMLLDQLPWSIHTIKLSWMEKVINVQWR